MIVAATGHRPHKLGGYDERTRTRLMMLAANHFIDTNPDRVISGMALGWDQAVAEAAVECGIPFVAAVPFEGQDSRWPSEARKLYAGLLRAAEAVEIVSDFPGPRAMEHRNEWMVDRANEMLALWDGSWGGTFNCIQYAKKRHVPVRNLWSQWSCSTDLTDLLA